MNSNLFGSTVLVFSVAPFKIDQNKGPVIIYVVGGGGREKYVGKLKISVSLPPPPADHVNSVFT